MSIPWSNKNAPAIDAKIHAANTEYKLKWIILLNIRPIVIDFNNVKL